MAPAPEPRFARIAAMIGDPTRARMLVALLDGTMATAGEIAAAAGVAPQTASAHLAKLLDAELVALRVQGRHRYFRLADGDVAHALEALSVVADKDRAAGRGTWSRAAMQPLRHARSCYGHLAGRLGVCLHDALVAQRAVTLRDERYEWSGDAVRWLDDAGFDASRVGPSVRGIAYPCVDWSERRDHFAGPLAVALLDHFVARRWLVRVGDSRALAVTAQGRPFFDRLVAQAAERP